VSTSHHIHHRPTRSTLWITHYRKDFAVENDDHTTHHSVTARTKVLLLNTPHNPTGKMFSRTELEQIAAIAQNHPTLTIISDEVYEHIVFDPVHEPHISIATLCPDQTLTLSSAGKTFSATGWKVGWAVGPAHLVKAVTAVQQWVNFSAATPNQDAIAHCLRQAELPFTIVPQPADDDASSSSSTPITFPTYYHYVAAEYRRKRGLLVDALQVAGMTPIVPPGGFFIMADTSGIDFPYESRYATMVTDAMPKGAPPKMPRDWALSRWLTEEVGVTAITT
jgi:aspartate/methionine/tyrosine aminotransferase